MRTLTLTNCEAHDNFPPAAFASVHQMAREGTLAAGLAALAADPDLARAAMASGLEHPERLSDETALGYLAPVASTEKAEAVQGYVASMDSSVTVAIRDDLARFGHPTLIVWGTADQFFAVSWTDGWRPLSPAPFAALRSTEPSCCFPAGRPETLNRELRDLWANDPGTHD